MQILLASPAHIDGPGFAITTSAFARTATASLVRKLSDRRESRPFNADDVILPSPPSDHERQFKARRRDIENSTLRSTDDRLEDGAIEHRVTPLIRLRDTPSPDRRFTVLQQWEGIVDEVDNDSICAEIVDLSNPNGEREVVELPITEVSSFDRSLLRAGSVFYWIIGYERSPVGQIRRVSEIRLRRTPSWSASDVNALQQTGSALYQQLMHNAPRNSTSQ